MGLHVELSADAGVAVDDKIVDAEGIQLLAAGQTRGAGTDNGHLGFVHLHRLRRLLGTLRRLEGDARQVGLVGDGAHLAHAVHGGDADAAHAAVHQHLAGAALAYAALQRTVTAVQAVAMHRKTSLVQRLGYRVALLGHHLVAFEHEFGLLPLRDVKNRVSFNPVHFCKCLWINMILYFVSK